MIELSGDILLLLVSVAFVAGCIDAMAGGGGLLTIPALLACGIPPVSALATNKLQSAVGTGSAFVTFLRAGQVDFRKFLVPAIGAFVGSVLGAAAVQHVDPSFLSALLPALLILIGLYFLFAPSISEADRNPLLGNAGLTMVIGGIGFYDGFFGPGTGSFLTAVLVALGGLGLVRSIANTKFLNLATNIAALIAMIAGGQVLWLLGGLMAMGNAAGNQVGAWLALRYGGKGVRPLLVLVSIGLALKLLSDPANPIWQFF